VATTDPSSFQRDADPGAQHALAGYLEEEIRKCRAAIERIPHEPVRGPRGQYLTRREARERYEFVKTKVDAAEAGGSLEHHTVDRSVKVLLLLVVALFDLPVMLWLVSSVFNVDWSAPVGVPLVISIVISVLATAGAAAILYHMGHIYRQNKNDRRELDWSGMSRLGKVVLVAVASLVALVALGMFARVFTEGELSGFSGLGLLVAVLVALVMLLSAGLIFFTAFRDGSLDQQDLAHYSALVHRGEQRRHDLEMQIDRHQGHLALLQQRRPEHRPADVDGGGAPVTRIDDLRHPPPPAHR
jgi:hypothetical protein